MQRTSLTSMLKFAFSKAATTTTIPAIVFGKLENFT